MGEGHRYDAPEPKEETRAKGIDYLILGVLVLVLMALVATGTVEVFDM